MRPGVPIAEDLQTTSLLRISHLDLPMRMSVGALDRSSGRALLRKNTCRTIEKNVEDPGRKIIGSFEEQKVLVFIWQRT